MTDTDAVRVVVLDDYQRIAPSLAEWEGSRYPLNVTFVSRHISDEDELVELLQDTTVIVAMRERTPLRESLLTRLPSLRLIVTTGTRNDSIDSVDGVTVCGTEILVHPTAEMTWALILSHLRRIPQESASLRSGAWQTSLGDSINGRTLGILGLGRIGRRVASVGRAFGMQVIAWSQNLTAEEAASVDVTRVDADALFAQADVLSVHLRLSARTRGLVDRGRLQAMKPHSLLVNTSRAEIIDQEALVEALNEGWIGGAALDVFDSEPLPVDHPFRGTAHTLLTPHLGYVVRQNYELFYPGAVEAIECFLDGHPIRVISQPVTASKRENGTACQIIHD